MTISSQPTSSDRDLVFERVIDAPPEKLFRAWTEPDLLKQWFTPRPWTVSFVETDVRPGGASLIVMRNPEGQEFPHRGVYLEVVEKKGGFTKAGRRRETSLLLLSPLFDTCT